MKCPMCDSENTTAISSNTMTAADRAGQAWGKLHPAAGLASLAFSLASAVAKVTLSKVYHCNDCRHQWRKW